VSSTIATADAARGEHGSVRCFERGQRLWLHGREVIFDYHRDETARVRYADESKARIVPLRKLALTREESLRGSPSLSRGRAPTDRIQELPGRARQTPSAARSAKRA